MKFKLFGSKKPQQNETQEIATETKEAPEISPTKEQFIDDSPPKEHKEQEIKNWDWLVSHIDGIDYEKLGIQDAQSSGDSQTKINGIKEQCNDVLLKAEFVKEHYKKLIRKENTLLAEYTDNGMVTSLTQTKEIIKEHEEDLEKVKNLKKEIEDEKGIFYNKIKAGYTKGFQKYLASKSES